MVQTRLLPTEAEVQFFRESGYWLAPKVLSDAELGALRDHMDRVYAGVHETGREPWLGGWKPGGDPNAIRKTDNAHWADLTLRALAFNETIGAMAARLIGADTIHLWHDQLLYKPGTGAAALPAGNVGWHQDLNYWQCAAPPDLLTAWVAFDDVNEENGCMQVIPGSHQWGLVEGGNFFFQDREAQERALKTPKGQSWRPVSCHLKAGELSFHHCLTLHGSGPNSADRPRRSLVLHLMPGNTRYRAGTPGDSHMNALKLKERGGKDGDLFASDNNPRIYPRE
jgi:ectoine hydroxylase-related dioxygenase (phytanoyl-CoA dioxygenase family)